ncbi:hypothetical protein [Sediminibacillus halophilus]|uniref:Uncharacterized protein n=1 Tax=Sediminibacillus halophilus TaxID=482461 RepID=A0A1G9LY50_9BACI|nr:hypothetical protein [Sediminibacillus halophilus]SDL66671.1 hypothetical protein SAMN05216244_0333 [Sediminibacillus halophilus]
MGAYYFYNEYVYDEDGWQSKSMIVEDGKFTRRINDKAPAREMNTKQFWVGPGKVYLDIEEPFYQQASLEVNLRKFIYRGCTLLLCQLPIRSHSNYKRNFASFQKKLTESPIDYMIVPRIPLSQIRPEMVRFFGRQKVPFILVEQDPVKEVQKIKWEWIHQAQSLTKIPLFMLSSSKRNHRQQSTCWPSVAPELDLTLVNPSELELPLPKKLLRKTGISPYKGELIPHASADYNLFLFQENQSIDEPHNFRYHKAIPEVTVAKGKVIKVNHIVKCRKGNGMYKKVSIPGHFV